MTKVVALFMITLSAANIAVNVFAPEPVEMHQPVRGPR
jgi:hypothetical protein